MAEQILEANIPCVVRFRKIVQFARELDVKCDSNYIAPYVALSKLMAVAGIADDDTVDTLVSGELASPSGVNVLSESLSSMAAGQVGVAYSWTYEVGEAAPAIASSSLVGELPTGLTHNADTLTVSGTPAAATEGAYLVEFYMADVADGEWVARLLFAVYPAA